MTPILCACGCGQPVKARARRWASRACCLRAIPFDVRSQRGKALAAKLGPAQLRERGRKGGRSSDVKRWGALLEQWQDMGPREALRAAYKRGYLSGYEAGTDARVNRAAEDAA